MGSKPIPNRLTYSGRVFITGGAGFIGSHLAESLIADRVPVTLLDNFDPYYDRSLKEQNLEAILKTAKSHGMAEQVEFIEGDIRDAKLIEKIYARAQARGERMHTMHLAALAGVRPSIERPDDYVSVNLQGLTNILIQAAKYGHKGFTFASSSSVYGESQAVPFSEDLPLNHPISPYAATKRAGELLCHTFHHLHGMSIGCLRFFTVYGPRQRPDLAISKFASLMLQDKPIPVFGDGTTRRDYTFVDDIVQGTKGSIFWADAGALAGTPHYEVFNLGESDPIVLNDMIQSLEKACGKPARIDRQPIQAGDVTQTWANVDKARAILGYAPRVRIEAGIARYLEWQKEHAKTAEVIPIAKQTKPASVARAASAKPRRKSG